MKKTIVCIGTYNEIETLPRLVERVLEQAQQDHAIELLVVDDDSPDGTGRWGAVLAAPPAETDEGTLHVLQVSGWYLGNEMLLRRRGANRVIARAPWRR